MTVAPPSNHTTRPAIDQHDNHCSSVAFLWIICNNWICNHCCEHIVGNSQTMPHLRGITVHVTDSHGNDLQEWGVQYLRQHTEGKRVSAYVESTTNVSFQVSVQPKIPFTGQVHSSDTSRGENAIARKIPARLRAGSEDRSTDQDHERLSNKTLSSPVRPFTTPQSRSAPDFAFLASLYLDGRKKPERKIVSALFGATVFQSTSSSRETCFGSKQFILLIRHAL